VATGCDSATGPVEARHWRIGGRVQGVGFRPFIYRLAREYGLSGWVQNRVGEVEVCTEGPAPAQERFAAALARRAPPLSSPRLLAMESITVSRFTDFTIRASDAAGTARIHVPPDYFTCNDCLAELEDPSDRRYRYPFINCTQCGPRYTLIQALPYDRPNTTMAGFELCVPCRAEYENPADRRFHAEPVACPQCGPQPEFVRPGVCRLEHAIALPACVDAFRAGQIIAVKGIGGYHLMCDACNDTAVARLRERKPRPHKPLAVMFPAPVDDPLRVVCAAVRLGDAESALLGSPMRPIVLAAQHPESPLSHLIAPGLCEVGVMLPYSPLHHLLLNAFGGPLVATSANISGEPVLTENAAVEQRLGHVAEAFLQHNRPIERPADDPVYRFIAGKARPLRPGRGGTPLERALPFTLARPVLAVGGHMKNTVALAWEDRIVVSPHIGDMGTPRSLAVFEQTIRDLQSLYRVRAEAVVCDAHPGYVTTHWAERSGLQIHRVFHHHAHAAVACEADPAAGDCLVFTWDGVGYGEDGTLWGGEALLGHPGNWRRVACLRPFHLPGGERAGREPWRSAAALCWETGQDWPQLPPGTAPLQQAWRRRLNAPQTTAAGRLFDAAAALTGLCFQASFEGQGPMELEAVCDTTADPVELPLTRDAAGLWIADWAPLLPRLLDDACPVARRAADFHASLAAMLLQQARRIREEHGIARIGLSGGVFQNRRLTEQAVAWLEQAGFAVMFPKDIPVNDAGLSFGQVIEYGSGHSSR